jgi:hypothetical protein
MWRHRGRGGVLAGRWSVLARRHEKGRKSKSRPAPKNATSPLGGVSLDEGRSSVSIQPNRKGGFYLHRNGSPRSIATFQQSSNKRPRLIHSGGSLLRPSLSHPKNPDSTSSAIRARLGDSCRQKGGQATAAQSLNAEFAQDVAKVRN